MRRFLTRVGDDYQPAWIVAVSIRAAAGEVRVIAVVYRGADYSVVETVTGNYAFDTEARALLELPREIAADVVRALGGVREATPPPSPPHTPRPADKTGMG